MQNNNGQICFMPIGTVNNQSKDAAWGETLQSMTWQDRAARMNEQRTSISEIVIDPGLEDLLDGIEEFSHIAVIYYAHLAPEGRKKAKKVHPIGNKDFPLVGIFATRSPIRPNCILVTVARLLERKGNILRVTGLDSLDGSPVLDIKPHYRDGDEKADEVRVPEWMQGINNRFVNNDSE